MVKPCSCTQFIKSQFLYCKSQKYLSVRLQVMWEFGISGYSTKAHFKVLLCLMKLGLVKLCMYIVYRILTNRIQALKRAAGYIVPGTTSPVRCV